MILRNHEERRDAPLQAGNRIKFQGFGYSNYKSREVGKSFRLLEKAMLIKLVYPTIATTPPAESEHKKSPKLQFLDTGIVNYAAGLQQYYFSLTDLNSIYSGKIAEHIVGQELLSNNSLINGDLKFWVREKAQSNAEVDYVVPYGRYIIPVEVKSGKTGTLKSLQQYMEITNHSFAVRLYAGKIQTEFLQTPSGKPFTLLSLPYYLIGHLHQYLNIFFKE
jgi:predicted AAA+ superfamily ATPase